MELYRIDSEIALFGEAYNNAINCVINHVNRLGWCWEYHKNWLDAHQLAAENGWLFDVDGNARYIVENEYYEEV